MPSSPPKKKAIKDTNIDPKVLRVLAKLNLPTLWADNILLQIRDDGVCLIRILSDLPEGMAEESRIMMKTDKLKKAITELCHKLQYFPKKEDAAADQLPPKITTH